MPQYSGESIPTPDSRGEGELPPPPPPLAGDPDRNTIATLVQLLSQQQQNQQTTVFPPPPPTTDRALERFMQFKQSRFIGEPNAQRAESWLEEMEKLFRLLKYGEEQKVEFVTFLCEGPAEYWWSSVNLRWKLGSLQYQVIATHAMRSTGLLDSDAVLSPNPLIKAPKDKSPKVVDRRSPPSPAIEKKRPSRISELEPQIAQLQDELKKAKDQLTSSESSKRRAQHEAEETKQQLAAMSAKLEETQRQLNDISDCEDSRVQELRKLSQERDRAWQSELEAVQKQHTMDSVALASAMNEVQTIKIQLERVSESEASHARHAESAHAEIQRLRVELTETLDLVEKLKNQLNDCRENESQALDEVSRAEMELEVVKGTEETLQLEHAKTIDFYKSSLVELEQSNDRVTSLEEVVANLQADLATASKISENSSSEVNDLKHKTSQLRAALEAAERRYQDEYLQSTLEIRNAYELVELAKTESCQLEAELEAKLKEYEAEAEELRMKLIEKENTFPKVGSVEETELEIELKKSESVLEELKLCLTEKEMRLQSITEENEKLKAEIEKWEIERSKASEEADEARSGEREALMKLGYLTEESDKSCRKTARVTEQLDAAQATNLEMEAELRRLKVQSDQWRKAAEAATAMLSTGNNGKHVGRTCSFDYHTVGGKLDVNYSEDMEEDSPKKKNGNVLRKIGVLLKKK